MNDKELADKVIALGIGEKIGNLYRIFYGGFGQDMAARDFVCDWRVAGECLERMSCMQISELCKQSNGLRYHGWLKKPRAIIEALCE